jgi:hypothetical protein
VPEWLTRYARPREGWLALALLLVMLLSVSWSVQRADWLSQLELLVPVAFYAAVLGAVLGLTSLSVVAVLPISAVMGAGIVLWATAGEYYPALDQLHRQLAVRTEVIDWVRIIADRGYGPQLVPYAIGLGALMWGTSFIAAYTIYRHHRVLDAILLVGAVLLVNMSATYTDLFFYLVLFVLAALLLWLRAALVGREEGWQRRRVSENSEVPAAVMRSGVLFIAGSIMLAWVLTSVAVAAPLTAVWNNLDGVWNNVRDNVDDIFAPLANPDARISGSGFGSGFSIQGKWISSDSPVLTMAAEEPYYLRTATYETYTGHGFSRDSTQSRRVDAGQQLFTDATPEVPYNLDAFDTKTVTIQYQEGQSHLFAPEGYPVQFFAPALVLETGGLPILGGLESPSFVSDGEGYAVTVLVSKATKSELRAAGTEYPAIVSQHYLAIDGVSVQTRQLAQEIIQRAGAQTPFDMAEALANYLRTNDTFRYATTADVPAAGQDFVDFFLFDPKGRVGYCEYYATTMAVLARTLGLPSRVAVGYSSGSLVTSPTGTGDRTYQYRQENSHAWTEIYFPGYGWQRFEATHGRSAAVRPNGAPVSPAPDSSGGPRPGQTLSPGDIGDVSNLPSFEPVSGGFRPGEDAPPPDARGPNLLLITAILLLVAAVAVWRLQNSRRRLRFLVPGERQWFRLALAADRAGIAQRSSETIYEYAGWLEEQIPAHRPEIRTIADGKVWQSYSGRGVSSDAIARIEAAWKRLQLPMVWLAIKRRIGSILPRRGRKS